MKIKFFTLIMFNVLCCFAANAQTYKLVTIHDIQFIPSDTLTNCHDKSRLLGDTVRVRGVAYMRGNQSTAYLTGKVSTAREIYIQDGSGPWSGLDVFTSGAGTKTNPVDIQTLVPGDSIEVTGVVSEFSGQTEVIPFLKTKGGATFSKQVTYLGTSTAGAHFTTVKISDLNNNKQVNQLGSGEQWESGFIELQNVTVTSATAQNASRIQFTVADADGNSAIIYDKFLVQRNSANPDTFKVPHVGDVFKSLKGVMAHFSSTQSCTAGTYEIYPFDTSHYHYSLSAPIILSVTRSPLVPKSTNDVTVTANVIPFGKRGIKSVDLYYKTGTDTSINTGYTKLSMTASGANYVATIPKQADGTTLKYYVTAIDTVTIKPLRSYSPAVKSPNIFPYFYTVRDKGLTIYDIQFRPSVLAYSAYNGTRVVVSGVVTASTKDLGYFYIQQPGIKEWAGINLKGSVQLVNYKTGDYVTVGGTVTETGNFTSLLVDSIAAATGSFAVSPITILDTLLTKGDLQYRKYMGMLATLKPATGSKMKVVQLNADGTSNFGDFRVGDDATKPTIGTRVSSGYNNANDPQSLNVAYVNDISLLGNVKVSPNRVLTLSDNMDSISGVIIYNFSNYKLMPRTTADIFGISNPVHVHDNGIEGNSSANGLISVYPNPAAGHVFVNLNNMENNGSVKISISDMIGRTVYTQTLASGVSQSDINLDLKAGAYIVTCTNAKGIIGETKLLISK